MTEDKNYHIMMTKYWKDRYAELESSYQTLMVKMKNDRDVENKKFEG